jgi:hypothetical protein
VRSVRAECHSSDEEQKHKNQQAKKQQEEEEEVRSAAAASAEANPPLLGPGRKIWQKASPSNHCNSVAVPIEC